MKHNKVGTVVAVNGSNEGQIFNGAGQKTIANVLHTFPLVDKKDKLRFTPERKGKASHTVILRGFMINDKFVPFNPDDYAHHTRH